MVGYVLILYAEINAAQYTSRTYQKIFSYHRLGKNGCYPDFICYC